MNAAEFLLPLGRASAAAGLLVLLVLAVQHLFRRHLTPQWHCALWLLVAARLLPLSVPSDVSFFHLFTWQAEDASTLTAETATAGSVAPPTGASPSSSGSHVETPFAWLGALSVSRNRSAVDASWGATALFFVWLGGVLVFAGHVMRSTVALTRSLRTARAVTAPETLNLLHACCDEMDVRRAPLLVESATVRSPALHGLFRHRLLLPQGFARTFSAEELRFVFLHELAHVRRRDLLLNWLMTALQIVHWFNPLVWFAFARWRVDRELACDAAALEAAGAANNQAYGRTMLRLLETFCPAGPQPGLVVILESRQQLHRRMKMIGGFRPSRRPVVGIGLLVILALVGLTDAPVASMVSPVAAGQAALADAPDSSAKDQPASDAPVLFLINRSESMLGLDEAEIAAWRSRPEAEKASAPKWQQVARTLEASLRTLPAGTKYRVVLCDESNAISLGDGVRDASPDDVGLRGMVQRVVRTPPAGGFSVEVAFGTLAQPPANGRPERVVLITDSLSTAALEPERQAVFRRAVKALPPRIPVHTLLLPLVSSDRTATGLCWELAHATRGSLTTVSLASAEPRTHLVFVIDTSGSMRDPQTGELWPIVIESVEATLDAHPNLAGVQLVDGDGRFLLGRRGQGRDAWHPATPEMRDRIVRTLRRADHDSISNPIPGVYNALRFLTEPGRSDLRIGVYLLGDEFVRTEDREVVLPRLDQLNPRDVNGHRRVVINAIGFPTTIRFSFSMGNTGARFADLMRTITREHDGSFAALPEL